MRLPPPSRSLLSPKVLGALYRKHLSDSRQERLFLGNVSALWLNLQDDYWTKEGRESIDAVVIFGSLLFLALMNRDLVREATLIASGHRDARELLGEIRP